MFQIFSPLFCQSGEEGQGEAVEKEELTAEEKAKKIKTDLQNAKEKREKRKRKIEKDEESSSSSESETEGETKKAKQKETKEEKEAGDKEVSVVKKAEAKPKIDIWKKR